MKFGDKLRALIEERGITQKELAVSLNVAASTLGSYVQNTHEPDFETLKRIAKYFGVSVDYLLSYHSGKAATHQEDDLLRIFRSLSDEHRALYLEQGRVFVKMDQKEKTISS